MEQAKKHPKITHADFADIRRVVDAVMGRQNADAPPIKEGRLNMQSFDADGCGRAGMQRQGGADKASIRRLFQWERPSVGAGSRLVEGGIDSHSR